MPITHRQIWERGLRDSLDGVVRKKSLLLLGIKFRPPESHLLTRWW